MSVDPDPADLELIEIISRIERKAAEVVDLERERLRRGLAPVLELEEGPT